MDINEISMGHEALATASRFIRGKNLIEQSDCKACHFIDRQSVGPTYQDIAGKYQDAEKASEYLADKIISGGGGVWGVNAMAAHPQHTVEEAQQMVDWILSLADMEKAGDLMPLAGTYRFDETNDHEEGSYILMASYTDKGGEGLEPLTSRELIRLRSPKFSAASYDTAVVASKFSLTADQASLMGSSQPLDILIAAPGGYVGYKDLDLTGIIALDIVAASNVRYSGGGTINVHIDSPQGQVIGTTEIAKPTSSGMLALSLPLKQVEGKHDLYLVFSGLSDQSVTTLITLEFRGDDPL
jgi:cytochrome c